MDSIVGDVLHNVYSNVDVNRRRYGPTRGVATLLPRQAMITCHHRCMDKTRPPIDTITIGDVVPARGVPVEQLPVQRLLEELCRNGLMLRNNDGSYAPTTYAIQTGALVAASHNDTDDNRGGHDSEDKQDHGSDVLTGWDINISNID